MIYFVQPQPGGPIKIGYASGGEEGARRRIIGVQVGCPWKLRVLLIIPGDQAREAGFHALFNEYRTHGEWFSPQDRLRDWLLAMHGVEAGPPLSFEREPNLELVK